MLKRLIAVLLLYWLLERSYGTIDRDPPLRRPPSPNTAFLASQGPAGFTVTLRGGLLRLDFASPVRVRTIEIFDLRGRPMFTYRPGKSFATLGWVWDGRDSRGRLLPRGRYQVRVQTGSGTMTSTVDWNPATFDR